MGGIWGYGVLALAFGLGWLVRSGLAWDLVDEVVDRQSRRIAQLEDSLAAMRAERDQISEECYRLLENPRHVLRCYETAVAVGCSHRGDFGRLPSVAIFDAEVE
jgi:hypothetical protein